MFSNDAQKANKIQDLIFDPSAEQRNDDIAKLIS